MNHEFAIECCIYWQGAAARRYAIARDCAASFANSRMAGYWQRDAAFAADMAMRYFDIAQEFCAYEIAQRAES